MKILVVDDEDDVRQIARLSLSAVGRMEVCEASGGSAAVRRAREEQPDAVLLDVMMPGMDGLATLRALQADPETSDIPVVFLTARSSPEDERRWKALGARGVLVKPFNPMTLPGRLRDLLDGP